ncbi:MAG: hypothetical protein ED557_12740 [Balneola sp.]|nr:MAG: hypothetical protein ED557_12740 [Balneola sp.]
MRYSLTLLLILLTISCSSDSPIEEITRACSEGDFLEIDGIAIIEMEKDSLPAGWLLNTEIDGYSGSGYIQWNGSDNFGNPGIGTITYTIHIENPGTYRFNWRSRIGVGNNNTEHNDNWLKLSDADEFYAVKNGTSRVYPYGSGQTPNPEGAGSNGWFKVYMNTLRSWHWDANTSDNDPHQIYATFSSSGTYTLLVSGRSNGHAIDRMILRHDSVSDLAAQSLALAPSICPGN